MASQPLAPGCQASSTAAVRSKALFRKAAKRTVEGPWNTIVARPEGSGVAASPFLR
jgi:hypothetical protein